MKNSKIYTYRDSSASISGPRLLGFILAGAGILVLISPWVIESGSSMEKTIAVGITAGLIGLILISLSSGILLDFGGNRIKHFQNVGWMKFGDWERIPQVLEIELIHHSFQSKNIPNGITPTMSGKMTMYKCVLKSSDEVILSLDFSKEKEAIVAMEEIQVMIQ
ncbi:hypothetical protein [Algoriphagus marinus]|uniref:hypothetical protein n=1 Tax=Algoriphagus marinus TaxID=1925762 RepID=UPI00094BBAA5|nr:hypothetical protein [Algoriphagus marinus]